MANVCNQYLKQVLPIIVYMHIHQPESTISTVDSELEYHFDPD